MSSVVPYCGCGLFDLGNLSSGVDVMSTSFSVLMWKYEACSKSDFSYINRNVRGSTSIGRFRDSEPSFSESN